MYSLRKHVPTVNALHSHFMHYLYRWAHGACRLWPVLFVNVHHWTSTPPPQKKDASSLWNFDPVQTKEFWTRIFLQVGTLTSKESMYMYYIWGYNLILFYDGVLFFHLIGQNAVTWYTAVSEYHPRCYQWISPTCKNQENQRESPILFCLFSKLN